LRAGAAFFLAVLLTAGASGIVRHAGLLQSINPSDMTLVIEETGPNGRIDLVEISIRNAEVVHVSRDPADPWRWRARRTNIYRWPVGTFLVVSGQAGTSGVVEALRVEIPKVPPD